MSNFRKLPAVIIPAYNEKEVISFLLEEAIKGVENKEYNVIVACNGCSDSTAKLVEAHFPLVKCLDISKPSKTNAINQAESLGLGFPRVYVDADVRLSHESILELIKAASDQLRPSLVVPRASIFDEASSFLVKTYYDTWKKTRFFIQEGFGSGVYVLNKEARSLFGEFPDIIADDGYIREVIEPSDVVVIEKAISEVNVPKSLLDLVKIKGRSKLGNMQLKKLNLTRDKKEQQKSFLISPNMHQKFIYNLVNILALINARLNIGKIDTYSWQRDNSSRTQ